MFTRLEGGLRQFGVLIHAGQNQNRIDIVVRDERRSSGGRRNRWMHGCDRRGLVAVDVECGGQSRLAALLELTNQLAVGPQKDATESKYSESQHVLSASLEPFRSLPRIVIGRVEQDRSEAEPEHQCAARPAERLGPALWSIRPSWMVAPAAGSSQMISGASGVVSLKRSPCESAESSSCGNTGQR